MLVRKPYEDALLTCEGQCLGKPTRHSFAFVTKFLKDDTQYHVYSCGRCKHTRVWGAEELDFNE